MKKIYTSILFCIIFFLLTLAIIFQIRIINESGTLSLNSYEKETLITELFKWKNRYEAVKKRTDEQNKIINEYERSTGDKNDFSDILNEELKNANILLGKYDLKGEGIIITLDDSELSPTEELPLKKLIVHDSDVLAIVNELNKAGAEAISVNDQRIIQTSEVKCVGPVIEVNNEKLAGPYIIRAIGNKDELFTKLNNDSEVVQALLTRMLKLDITGSNDILIYKKEYNCEYLNVKED